MEYNNLSSFRHMTANSLNLKPYPFKLEYAMKGYILEHPNILDFKDKAEKYISPKVLNDEEFVRYSVSKDNKTFGRIDLLIEYSYEDKNNIGIMELKKEEINFDTFKQLKKYIEEIFNGSNNSLKNKINNDYKEVFAIMGGTSISPELATAIIEGKDEKGDRFVIKVAGKEIKVGALVLNRFRGEDGSVYVINDIYKPRKTMGNIRERFKFNMIGAKIGEKIELKTQIADEDILDENGNPYIAEILKNNKIKVLNDCYDGKNPTSVSGAVEYIIKEKTGVERGLSGPLYWEYDCQEYGKKTLDELRNCYEKNEKK